MDSWFINSIIAMTAFGGMQALFKVPAAKGYNKSVYSFLGFFVATAPKTARKITQSLTAPAARRRRVATTQNVGCGSAKSCGYAGASAESVQSFWIT